MKKVLFVIAALVICGAVFANGGIPWETIDSQGPKISLKNDPNLVLAKEDLKIQLVEDCAIVTCEYELVNKSKEEKTIDFAFNIPVVLGSHGIDYFLDYYKIIENKSFLPYTTKKETGEDGPWETSFDIWKISTLKFNASESKKLTIIYKIKTNTDGKSCAAAYSNNIFKYNLFPATSFGNGVIPEFNLTIDKSDVSCREGRIVKISGLDIKNEASQTVQVFSFKNFDLRSNRELEIEYNIAGYYVSKFLLDRNCRRYFSAITASSTLTEGKIVYSAKNLNDYDYSTPWVEGKKDFGKNEKIHFELDEYNSKKDYTGLSITHLYVVNGFRKNEKTYLENNRLKKIRLYINGTVFCDIDLPDRPYSEIDNNNLAYEADLLNTLIDDKVSSRSFSYSRRAFYDVKNFDIEILDVYPGTKYNDTCISEVVVMNVEQPTI